MTTHLNEDELVLHYYGEMEGTEETRAAAHLSDCPACHASYTRLQRVLAAVEAAPGPEISEGFERTVWARLEPGLTPQRRWLSWLVFSPARLAWGAAVLALVTGSFFAGRSWDRGVPTGTAIPSPSTTVASNSSPADLRERIMLIDIGEHLDRSQTMLTELVSSDEGGTVDFAAERGRAEELVSANRLYRQTATATGDRAIADLLDELERVLVDIAASPEKLTASQLEEVRQRIDAAGLLFKVRVMSSQVRERQKTEVRVRTGQSS
jgi:hypothetical protein